MDFIGFPSLRGPTQFLGYRPTTINRRSSKKVTFSSPRSSPARRRSRRSRKRRTSKKRSPRSEIIYNVAEGFKRMSPSRIKNQRARDLAEFVQALSPALIAALSIYLYTLYEHKNDKKNEHEITGILKN